jgi:hypothetical protein
MSSDLGTAGRQACDARRNVRNGSKADVQRDTDRPQMGAEMSRFQLQLSVQHPVLFLSDPTGDETVPLDTGAAVVTATDDCVCFWVQPYVDGEAQVTISDQPCEDGVACFSGTISTPGKIVTLSDSNKFAYLNMPVKDVQTRFDVWASDATQPELTWIRLPIAAY